ncbi:MAG: hypothetical protein KDA86_11310 [Planctomycetaceae bacterium]|nr:hypothetical protein [Planctomycetaceae bacterium]
MSTAPLDSRTSLTDLRERLVSRLSAVRRAMRAHFVAEAGAWVVSTLVALLALSLLLDWWLELSRVGRAGYAVVGFGLLGWIAWRYMVQPLSLSLAPLDVAAAVDRSRSASAREAVAPRVASVLQLPDHMNQPRGSSTDMIENAVRHNFASLEGVDFRSALNGKHLATSLGITLATLVLPMLFSLAAPGPARLWAARWLQGSDQPWPRNTRIEVIGVEDGRYVVPRGEPSSLQVLVHDKESPTEIVHMRMRSSSGRDETITLTRFEEGDFRYDLPPLQQTVSVDIWGGDGRAEPFQIVPIDRPRITDLKLTATHPRLSEPQVFGFTGEEGSVRLLPQTAAVLELTSNVPVSMIEIENDGPGPHEFRQTGETTFVTEWTHDGPVKMRISMTSQEAGLVSHPRPLTIGEQPDRQPRLSLRHSGVRQRITPVATIPMEVIARDDFGVKRVALLVEMPSKGTSDLEEEVFDEQSVDDEPADDEAETDSIDSDNESHAADESSQENVSDEEPSGANISGDMGAIPDNAIVLFGPQEPATETAVEQSHSIEVGDLKVGAGGVVSVQALAEDDCFTGSQLTQSRKTVFRVVSPEELFKEIRLRQQQLRARLRKQYDGAIVLRDSIRTATLPDDASTLLRTHQLIRREVGQVSRALDATVLEMRLNKLGGPESWDLIETNVLEPLTRLHDSEMELQRQSLVSLTGSEPESIEQIANQQQSLVDSLKRILDNMAQWDSFIDVVNQLNAVIKLETNVRQETEALRQEQVEDIFDE